MNHIDHLIKRHAPNGVEYKTLGEVARIKAGPNINKKMIAENPGEYPVINSGRAPLGYVSTYNTEGDPIGIASRGSVGLVTWTPGRFFRGNLNYSCSVYSSDLVDARYLFHYLLSADAEIQALAEIADDQGQVLARTAQQIGVLQTKDGELLAGIQAVAEIADAQGETLASAQQTLAALSDPLTGLLAQYLLRVNVHGVCAGFGVSNNGQFSEFKIQADRFLVTTSTGDTSATPFYLGELPGGGYGMVLRGDIIARGSVVAEALAVQYLSAISANLGDITSGRVKTGDLEVAEGGRVVVGNNNIILDSNHNALLVCPDGGNIAGNDCVVLDSAGLKIYYWDFATNRYVFHKPLVRIESGTCGSGDMVYLPGLWRETPRIQVSLNTLLGYDPAYMNQKQTWNVRAEDLREYAPATGADQSGTGYWKFRAIARLELGGANGTEPVNKSSGTTASDAWTSGVFETPANCSAITLSVNLTSVRGTGTAPNYNYRNVSWRVGYSATPDGPAAWTPARVKAIGATLAQTSDAMTVAFPSAGKWYCWVEFSAADAGGAFQSGSGGTQYQTRTVTWAGPTRTVQAASNSGTVTDSTTISLPYPSFDPGFALTGVDYSYQYAADAAGTYPSSGGTVKTTLHSSLTKTSSLSSFATRSSSQGSFLSAIVVTASASGTAAYGGYAAIIVKNVTATCTASKAATNDPTAQNTFLVESFTYVLATATILATGTCNYIATGR